MKSVYILYVFHRGKNSYCAKADYNIGSDRRDVAGGYLFFSRLFVIILYSPVPVQYRLLDRLIGRYGGLDVRCVRLVPGPRKGDFPT